MSTSIAGIQRKPGGETYLFKASYMSTPNAGGYYTDAYGNFRHNSTTATNSWNIKKNDGTNVFTVNFESGATTISGNTDVKGNQVVIGDTNRTYAQVKFITTNYTDGFIRAYDKNEYGQNWVIKPGGSMIIGGGESPGSLYSNDIDGCATAGNEQLFLSSDSLVHIYSNANTIENRKHWYFNNAGQIYLPDGVARISEDGNIYLNTAAVTGWLSTILSNLMPTWVNRHTAFNDVSVASGSNVNLGSFSLASAGVYLIQLTVQYAANANGDRHVWLSSTSGGNAVSLQARGQLRAASSGNTVVHAICFANPSSAITYYVVGNQNSGATLNANARINIIRLMAQ